MSHLLIAPSFKDSRGCLTVIEKLLPFSINRVFYIYNASSKRGGHGHKNSTVALIALNGTIDIYVQEPNVDKVYHLSSPDQVLILESVDWHEMDNFSTGSVLLVLSSHQFDKNDYFHTPYREILWTK